MKAIVRNAACSIGILATLTLAAAARADTFDPAAVGLPAAERFVLDSGLTVIFVPNQANPFLEVQLAFRAGSGADPAPKSGLASILARMLTAGTASLDEAALAAEIARLGGWIGAEAEADSFGIGAQIPTLVEADVRRLLALYADVVLRPALPESIVTREKALRLDLFARVADDANSLRELAGNLATFGDNAYGRAGYGRPATINAMKRDDIAAMHAALFNPTHGVLVVGGAFDVGAMRAWVAAHFGKAAWPSGQRADEGALPGYKTRLCAKVASAGEVVCFDNARAAAPAPKTQAARTIHVVIDDESLTQIPWSLVAANPVSELDARWPAFRLATFILGGDFTSRLNATLRTKEGLTYGAYFQTGFAAHFSGKLGIATDATPDALAKSIAIGKRELTRLRDEPVEAVELEQNRAMMVNGFAFRFETLSDTIARYMNLAVEQKPLSWLAGWRQALGQPTAADVQASMSVVDPQHMALVIVGPASLAPTIATLAHGPVTTVTASDLIAKGLL